MVPQVQQVLSLAHFFSNEIFSSPFFIGAPFPDSLVGKSTGGIIHEVFKTKFGTGKFGFILVGEGDFDRDTVPRIYFNFTEFSDSDYSAPRKG